MHLLALIKPQFEAGAQACQERHHPRRGGARGGLRRHRRLRRDRWAAPTSRCFPRRSRAATATSNSSSARAVVERLVIDHVGHLGDGVASVDGQPSTCPIRWAARRVEVAAGPRPSRPPAPARGRAREPRARSRRSARISASAAAARSSTGTPTPIAPGSAIWWSRRWRRQARLRGRAADRRPWRRPAADHAACAAWARTTCSRSALPRRARTTSSRSIAARSSIPALSGALDAALGAGRAAECRPESRSTSRSPRPTTASTSTSAAPGRCRRDHDRNAVAAAPSSIGWRG